MSQLARAALMLPLLVGLCSAISLPVVAVASVTLQLCAASGHTHWTAPALLGAAALVAAGPPLVVAREMHRNKDDKRRMRLTKEKVQHVERAIRYADYGDGYARLERQ